MSLTVAGRNYVRELLTKDCWVALVSHGAEVAPPGQRGYSRQRLPSVGHEMAFGPCIAHEWRVTHVAVLATHTASLSNAIETKPLAMLVKPGQSLRLQIT